MLLSQIRLIMMLGSSKLLIAMLICHESGGSMFIFARLAGMRIFDNLTSFESFRIFLLNFL